MFVQTTSSTLFFKLYCSRKDATISWQLISSFFAIYSEISPFCFFKYIGQNKSEQGVRIGQQCVEICFQPNCRHHNLLQDNVEDLLQKQNALSFTYQHVDCLYILFKYQFIGKKFVKSGQVFAIVQRAVFFIQNNREVNRMLSIAKKGN